MGSIYAYWYGEVGSHVSADAALYVGKTEDDPKVRFASHFAAAKTKNASLLESKLATKDHGIVRAVIEPNVPNDKLAAREKHWIATLRTHVSQGGCNETWGG